MAGRRHSPVIVGLFPYGFCTEDFTEIQTEFPENPSMESEKAARQCWAPKIGKTYSDWATREAETHQLLKIPLGRS